MAFTGSVRDEEAARLTSQTILLAEELGYLVNGDLTSLTAAKAAVDAEAAANSTQIGQNIYANQFKRALDLAVVYGGDATVTSSSLATLYAALPDNYGRTARLKM